MTSPAGFAGSDDYVEQPDIRPAENGARADVKSGDSTLLPTAHKSMIKSQARP
jgi:hypothetical protein